MTGLELSKKYFFEACKPVLEREIPEKLDRIAACLVGEGSDCFGWDDEISRDHGWGPRVCLVLTQADMEDFGDRLKEIAALFPGRYEVSATQGSTLVLFGQLKDDSFYRAKRVLDQEA